jgi:hypothetical protein
VVEQPGIHRAGGGQRDVGKEANRTSASFLRTRSSQAKDLRPRFGGVAVVLGCGQERAAVRTGRDSGLAQHGELLAHLHASAKIPVGTPAVTGAYSGDFAFAPTAAKSGTGAVISPIVKAATSTGEGAKATVSCPAGAASCPIVVNLSVVESGSGAVAASKKAKRPKRKKITIGSTKLTLAGGEQRAVSVSLNGPGKRLLAKHKRLTALLTVTTGGTVVKTQRIELKRH